MSSTGNHPASGVLRPAPQHTERGEPATALADGSASHAPPAGGLPTESAAVRALTDALDPEQRAAALAVTGPVRILAGAGTGKTRTITHRIAVQVASGTARHDEVLAVTFTDRAAGELRERLARLGLPGPVRAATFHSAAWAQLRHFWPQLSDRPRPQVLDRKIGLLRPLAERLRVDVRDLAAEIEWGQARLLRPETYVEGVAGAGRDAPAEPAHLAEAWQAYEDAKAARDLIDYDDMLRLCTDALREHPSVAEAVRDRYRVFTVDEFQDVNPAQWELLRAWVGERRELCVVGDDDQTIYRFTGASSRYLLGFEQAFPEARTVTLTRSYRSTAPVLDLANRVLWTKPRHLRKALTSTRGAGPTPQLVEHADAEDEQRAVTAEIRRLLEAGVPAGEIAVCYRINSQAADWEEPLRAAGIPVVVRGERGGFFAHPAVAQALRVLTAEAATTPDGPPANIAPDRQGAAWPPGTSPASAPDPVAALERVLRGALAWHPGQPPAGATARDRWEHLTALRDLCQRTVAEQPERFGVHGGFAELVDDLRARAAAGQETADPDGAVTLLTLHRAKGLEFDAVFLVACEEGLLPISHAATEEAIEDERRLLYVGVTRARRHLRLSWSRARGGRSRRPSRLLHGLGQDAPAAAGAATAGGASARSARRRGSTRSGGRGAGRAPDRDPRARAAPPAEDGSSASTCGCGAPLIAALDRRTGRCADCRPDVGAADAVLGTLKAWRRHQAAEEEVPAFCVFADKTLELIAAQQPASLEELATVPGVGPTKLERYGAAVLERCAPTRPDRGGDA